jgi:RNA-dependent RNA polymerase
MYISDGVLGKLYRDIHDSTRQERSNFMWSKKIAEATYDQDLEVKGFEDFLGIASIYKEKYMEKMSTLMDYYGAKTEDEILTGNLRHRPTYLQRDNRKYGDVKDRILVSLKNLKKEAKEWFESSCNPTEHQCMASAWYHVTYHPTYFHERMNCLSFPWIVGDILLNIKSLNSRNA